MKDNWKPNGVDPQTNEPVNGPPNQVYPSQQTCDDVKRKEVYHSVAPVVGSPVVGDANVK